MFEYVLNERVVKIKFEMLIEHPDGDKYKHESELRKEDMAHAIDMIILS